MKYKLPNTRVLILLIIGSFLLIPFITSWRENPPNYTTGAPGEFTCNVCHAPDPNNPQTGTLELSGLPDTLAAEQTYRIKVRLTLTSGQAHFGGFQLTAIGKDQRQFGVLSNPSAGAGVEQQLFRQYLEHSGSNIFTNNILEWEADWTTPDVRTKSQEVKFYFTGLLGNNDSTANGDHTLIADQTYYFQSDYKELKVSITSQDASCAGVNDGSATAIARDGTPPYQFHWSNGSNSPFVDSLKAGSYRVTIIDAGPDTVSQVVTISEPGPVFGRIIKTDIPCNAEVKAQAIVVPATGVAPFTYTWSNGDTATVTNYEQPGKISVTITDANGCTYVANSFILNQDTFKLTTTNVTNVRCNGGASGTATVQANIPFVTSYLWSDGQIGATASNLAAGEYTVTATSPAGCEVVSSVTIREPAEISVRTNTLTHPSCAGGYNGILSIFADGGVPPYTYHWDNGTADKTRINLIAGQYTVTVTDAFGCAVMQTFLLKDPDSLNVLVQAVGETARGANDAQAAALVNGGNEPYTYQWSNGARTQSIEGLKPGYYEVTVTDIKGCKFEKSIQIQPFECDLTLNQIEKTNVLCHGEKTGAISFEPAGGTLPYTIRWSNGAKINAINGLAAGNYSVEVKDSTGCLTNGFFVVNTAPRLIKTITLTDATAQFSSDGEIKFSLAGGTVPYTIEVDAVDTIVSYNGIVTFKNLFNGLHSYSITDGNGCRTSDFFVINVGGCQLNVDSINISPVKCFGEANGEICIVPGNVTGNATIYWDDETTDRCRSNLPAGSYSVHIEDEGGCQFLDTFTIEQPQALKVSLLTIDTPTVDNNNGSIRLVISGGTAPVEVVWTKNGEFFDGDITQIGEGNYHYIATDANGCILEGDTIRLRSTTTANRNLQHAGLMVFPNPAQETFLIPFQLHTADRVELTDIQGRKYNLQGVSQDQATAFDIRDLPNGVYVITVRQGQTYYHGKLSILRR